ncbi:unnamed protein product [Symbiodinium sp. KB8]|nr:unnamed protein product [Symbiodinium sp. KB8]|mmetsp:Transcript_36935/g.88246  ORF Transcript_36935/g.88246 Transcript_36935/m.88246 type:complete len:248 (-) Transcript_36935:75-818(-)
MNFPVTDIRPPSPRERKAGRRPPGGFWSSEGKSTTDSFPADSDDHKIAFASDEASGANRTRVCLDLGELADDHCHSEDEKACAGHVPGRTNAMQKMPTVPRSFSDDEEEAMTFSFFDSERGDGKGLMKAESGKTTPWRLRDIVLRCRASGKGLSSPAPAPPSAPETPSLRSLVSRPTSKTPRRESFTGPDRRTSIDSGVHLKEVDIDVAHTKSSQVRPQSGKLPVVRGHSLGQALCDLKKKATRIQL